MRDICIETAKSGNVDLGYKIVDTIKDEYMKSSAIFHIFYNQEITIDQANQALKTANKMTDIHTKETTLGYICATIAKIGMIDEALKIADMINSDHNKGIALSFICNNNLTSEQTDQILNILSEFDSDYDKYCALEKITDKFVKSGEIDKAFNIANMLTDTKIMFATICSEVAKTGNVNSAFDFLLSMHFVSKFYLVLRKISLKVL